MSNLAALGPRPGERCIVCGTPITVTDQWAGPRGAYYHARCHNVATFNATKKVDKYGYVREYTTDLDYEDQYENDYPFHPDENAEYQRGYERGYSNGMMDDSTRRADERMLRNELDSVRSQLDRLDVPAQIDFARYGPGQAGRLAWYLDRTSFKIYEIGHPDALVEG